MNITKYPVWILFWGIPVVQYEKLVRALGQD